MGLITNAPDPVPPSRLATWLARPSSCLFAGAGALAMAAIALTLPPLLIWFAAGVVAVIGGIVRVARVNG